MSSEELPPRESMEFDVVIVGAGPSGLSAAIRLINGATQSSGSDAASVTPDFLSCAWIASLTSMAFIDGA